MGIVLVCRVLSDPHNYTISVEAQRHLLLPWRQELAAIQALAPASRAYAVALAGRTEPLIDHLRIRPAAALPDPVSIVIILAATRLA